MEIEEKERLARVNDMGLEACAIRLRAASYTIGLAQQEMAKLSGVSKTVLNNAEGGLTYPSRDVMKFLYRTHRIDFNFLMNGNLSQLPGDVQDALLPNLEIATSEWDQKERSGRAQAEPKPLQ